jgi:hypothetical protein
VGETWSAIPEVRKRSVIYMTIRQYVGNVVNPRAQFSGEMSRNTFDFRDVREYGLVQIIGLM